MARAPFNVLVIPFRASGGSFQYAVLHRSDGDVWQFIAGGGEDDETPAAAARREAAEEGGIDHAPHWLPLDAIASIPRSVFRHATWPDTVYVIPQYPFAVEVDGGDLRLSREHDRHAWLDFDAAHERLRWDSNRVALWELRERLQRRR
jgi:dihydroneopterin triphosphate diphosphatase